MKLRSHTCKTINLIGLDKGDYLDNSHVVFCPNKQRSFEPFMFGSCFRTLAVILGSDFCCCRIPQLSTPGVPVFAH